MHRIRERSSEFRGTAQVEWIDRDGCEHDEPAVSALLDREIYLAEPFRKGKRYPRQRSYQGLYFMESTSSHVWHESRFESRMLMHLDRQQNIVAIAAQPMRITFTNGLTHVPDFLAMRDDQSQVVFDVRPRQRVNTKAFEQFSATQAVCNNVGWGFEVLSGLGEQAMANLIWLSQFKHPGFFPGNDRTMRLVEFLNSPMPISTAARFLHAQNLANGRSALFHLLWLGLVETDLNQPLNNRTLIAKATS